MCITCKESVVSVVFVMKKEISSEGSVIGVIRVGCSKDRSLVNDSSRVIVIVADCVHTLSALVVSTTLIDRCEWV
jgi:hypothetical protein